MSKNEHDADPRMALICYPNEDFSNLLTIILKPPLFIGFDQRANTSIFLIDESNTTLPNEQPTEITIPESIEVGFYFAPFPSRIVNICAQNSSEVVHQPLSNTDFSLQTKSREFSVFVANNEKELALKAKRFIVSRNARTASEQEGPFRPDVKNNSMIII